jgi:hypothetical protein
MSEMVECVAKAICASCEGNLPWERQPEAYREGFRASARKAIEAMREPTQAIVNGGIRNGVVNGFGCGYDDYVELWKAMIDEALK